MDTLLSLSTIFRGSKVGKLSASLATADWRLVTHPLPIESPPLSSATPYLSQVTAAARAAHPSADRGFISVTVCISLFNVEYTI